MRSRCKSFGALKEALRRIRASATQLHVLAICNRSCKLGALLLLLLLLLVLLFAVEKVKSGDESVRKLVQAAAAMK